MKYSIIFLLFFLFVFRIVAYAQKIDTTAIDIMLPGYYDRVWESEYVVGDTISKKTFQKTNINIILYDSVGSLAIYETHQDQSVSLKEYVGTGRVIYSTETFSIPTGDGTYITTAQIHRMYEQVKNGVWEKWNKDGYLTNQSIFVNDSLVYSWGPSHTFGSNEMNYHLGDDSNIIFNKVLKVRDTISNLIDNKISNSAILCDTTGSMILLEYEDNRLRSRREFIGTGNFDESYFSYNTNDMGNNWGIMQSRIYHQKKNGFWLKWNARGQLDEASIYLDGILLRSIKL